MADATAVEQLSAGGPSSAANWDAFSDKLFRRLVMAASIVVLLSLSAAALSMLWGGSLAFYTLGWPFVVSTDWDPVTRQFGALVSIYGTIVSALIAMMIAMPISFGIALYITEIAPAWMRGPVAMRIEFLAAKGRLVDCSLTECPMCPHPGLPSVEVTPPSHLLVELCSHWTSSPAERLA